MTYNKQTWADNSAGGTPITAARLGHIEDGIAAAAVVAELGVPGTPAGDAERAAFASDDVPSYAGIRSNRYDPRTSGYNWKASNTRRLRTSLGRAQAGTGLAQHAFIGDSETAYFIGTGADPLGMWPLVYRSVLASLGVPSAGSGVVFTADSGAGPLDPRWAYTGTWANANEYRSVATSGATATFTSTQAGTTASVWYYGTSAAFTVTIDAGSPVTVTPTGGLTVQKYTVTGLSNTTHAVKITTTSASTVYILAADVSGTTGLLVHNLGRYGSTASGSGEGAWLDTSSPTNTYGARTGCLPVTPDVVWIALGVNDINGGGDAVTTMSAVGTIAGRFASSDVILVAQYQPGNNVNWPGYVSALYDLADSLNVPLLDLYDRSGGSPTATANGLMGDTVHPNAAGQRDWGRAAALLAAG